ncbi:protein-ADP-ribose hydrolase [Fusobacterium simiae]|nr:MULTISPECIES: protein-ADP-ribose hydrolase [Fusobacterium]MDC7954256.1 protein-ADP-ribose hydrolase [Fusobacterium simiae]
MTQNERRIYLIKRLIDERKIYSNTEIPTEIDGQKRLLRALFNIREPKEIDSEFLKIQDEYLKYELEEKGIVDIEDLKPIKENIYLWQGDITRLKVDAIVNAANSEMLGCFVPNHSCIDNIIHTYSGIQLRMECHRLMLEQGKNEETGKAKITSAYNLPSKYVIHTVGPIVFGELRDEHRELLKSCYNSILNLVKENNLKSVAFCCISTGEFHFPNEEAAKIAIGTVQEFLEKNKINIKVVFNVFKDKDYEIYKRLLG